MFEPVGLADAYRKRESVLVQRLSSGSRTTYDDGRLASPTSQIRTLRHTTSKHSKDSAQPVARHCLNGNAGLSTMPVTER